MTQLDNYWDVESGVTEKNDTYGITVQTALYDPTLTVMNEARGKLYCIARPTSEHQDYGYDVLDLDGYNYASTDEENINIGKKMCIDTDAPTSYTKMGLPAINDHIMVIHGWGPLKDKWQQRGYTNYSIRS
jgi:hypothetical protein